MDKGIQHSDMFLLKFEEGREGTGTMRRVGHAGGLCVTARQGRGTEAQLPLWTWGWFAGAVGQARPSVNNPLGAQGCAALLLGVLGRAALQTGWC